MGSGGSAPVRFRRRMVSRFPGNRAVRFSTNATGCTRTIDEIVGDAVEVFVGHQGGVSSWSRNRSRSAGVRPGPAHIGAYGHGRYGRGLATCGGCVSWRGAGDSPPRTAPAGPDRLDTYRKMTTTATQAPGGRPVVFRNRTSMSPAGRPSRPPMTIRICCAVRSQAISQGGRQAGSVAASRIIFTASISSARSTERASWPGGASALLSRRRCGAGAGSRRPRGHGRAGCVRRAGRGAMSFGPSRAPCFPGWERVWATTASVITEPLESLAP